MENKKHEECKIMRETKKFFPHLNRVENLYDKLRYKSFNESFLISEKTRVT